MNGSTTGRKPNLALGPQSKSQRFNTLSLTRFGSQSLVHHHNFELTYSFSFRRSRSLSSPGVWFPALEVRLCPNYQSTDLSSRLEEDVYPASISSSLTSYSCHGMCFYQVGRMDVKLNCNISNNFNTRSSNSTVVMICNHEVQEITGETATQTKLYTGIPHRTPSEGSRSG